MKIVIEPSSAVAVAALFRNRMEFKNRRIGVILSGGNADLDSLPFWKKIAQHADKSTSRYMKARKRCWHTFPDQRFADHIYLCTLAMEKGHFFSTYWLKLLLSGQVKPFTCLFLFYENDIFWRRDCTGDQDTRFRRPGAHLPVQLPCNWKLCYSPPGQYRTGKGCFSGTVGINHLAWCR